MNEEWNRPFCTKAENDYKNGVRITADDCIRVCLDSLSLHREALRTTPLKKYFREMIEIDKMQLKEWMEIKNKKKKCIFQKKIGS